jgi:Transposase
LRSARSLRGVRGSVSCWSGLANSTASGCGCSRTFGTCRGSLERFLIDRGETVVRLPPRLMANARQGVRERGKSDPIDALAIARAALREGIDTLPTARLAGAELEIRLLALHREQLVDTSAEPEHALGPALAGFWLALRPEGHPHASSGWLQSDGTSGRTPASARGRNAARAATADLLGV